MAEFLHDCLSKFFPEDELRVYHVEDGLSGIKHAEKIQPDLIILDVLLPVLSGVKVYEKLTSPPHICHPKFIIISGSIEYKPNNTVFIPKPIKPTKFIKSVEKLTGLQASVSQSP